MNSGIHAKGKRDHRKILMKEYKARIKEVVNKIFEKSSTLDANDKDRTLNDLQSEFKKKLSQTDYNLY